MSKPKKNILLVEDDQDISRSIAFCLRKQGYTVKATEDGMAGLKLALQDIPDLIVLDLMLPSFSGEELCKSIREHDDEKIQKIPIIMLTAKSSQADAIVGRVIGANYYMVKPFSIEDLMEKIRELTSLDDSERSRHSKT